MARPGRKVQLVEASLFSADTEVARCIALRIRRAELELPADPAARRAPAGSRVAASPDMPPWAAQATYRAFHSAGVEHRFVAGSFEQPGPATDWIRLRVPLVERRGDVAAQSRRCRRRFRQRHELGVAPRRRLQLHQPRSH